MSLVVKDFIDAGVHYGHRASRWNPKMKPYIYGKRNLIHIIDLKETVRGLLRAIKFFNRVASANGLILFVGTKRQAAETIIEQCNRSGMPYVTERWLGGTLTNFRTIRSRLQRLEELEKTLDSEQALSYSKKMISTLSRERKKIERNLSGIRHMNRLPEALLVVDPRREHIAVAEARQARHQGRRPARHRLRPRRDRPADPRQRRQHAVDRAGHQTVVRRDHRGQGPAPRSRLRRRHRPGTRRRPRPGGRAAVRSGRGEGIRGAVKQRDTEPKPAAPCRNQRPSRMTDHAASSRPTAAAEVTASASRDNDPTKQPVGARSDEGCRATARIRRLVPDPHWIETVVYR